MLACSCALTARPSTARTASGQPARTMVWISPLLEERLHLLEPAHRCRIEETLQPAPPAPVHRPPHKSAPSTRQGRARARAPARRRRNRAAQQVPRRCPCRARGTRAAPVGTTWLLSTRTPSRLWPSPMASGPAAQRIHVELLHWGVADVLGTLRPTPKVEAPPTESRVNGVRAPTGGWCRCRRA